MINLLCAVTNAVIALIIYILLVKFINGNITPETYTISKKYENCLELFIIISVFLSFIVNKIFINGCI